MGMVLVFPACKGLPRQEKHEGDRWVVAEVEVFPVYADEYRDEATSL